MLNVENSYQTVPLPTGEIKGIFPTIEWYRKISKHLNFNGKTVLDLGCCTFSYGIQAINDGASLITGVENSDDRIRQCKDILTEWGISKAEIIREDIEKFVPCGTYDVIIFSMVIHWLENPEVNIKRLVCYGKKIVFVYRYPQEKKEIGYRPSIDQLDSLMGEKAMIHEILSDTEEQRIHLVIYDRNSI